MPFEVSTRQKADRLFELSDPLAAGQEVCLPARTVSGYDRVRILAFGDQPFEIRVEEGCSCDGPFPMTTVLASSPGVPAGTHVLCETVLPCGAAMRLCPSNPGAAAQTEFTLCAEGVPEP